MIRKMKKGFTIVELVIVIAVIAVLTAILVPTFISISNKADRASDQSLVKNLNTALKIVENDQTIDPNGKNVTMHDAVEDLAAYGYDLSKLVTKSDEKIVWNSTDNQFYFEQGQNSLAYWKMANTVSEAESETKYSVYANKANAFAGAYLTVKTSFDAGYNDTIAQVNLKSDATETYLVRTNGGILTVDAPNATINHLNGIDVVVVEHVDRNASYHEFGRVEVSLDMKDGHAVVEEGGFINELNVPQTAAGDSVSVDVKADGEVASAIVDDASASVVIASGAKVGQYVGDTTNVSGAGAQEVKEKAIEKTEVATEADLRKAIDTDHSKYIVFTDDITATALYLITTDVNIDGNGHKLTSKANRIFRVGGSDIEVVFQNLDMKTTYSSSDSRGISIDSNFENINLSIIDCTIEAKYYAINITGVNGSGSKNINLNVISSTVKGYAAINNHASLINIVVNDSTLIGYNQFSAGSSNSFSTIVFDGSNYEAEGSTSYGSKIIVKNSTLRQITLTTNYQTAFNSQYGNVNSEAHFNNVVVEHEGENAKYFNFAYPKTNNVKIFMDGELLYEGY